ncbi:MAG: tRNA (adenosine(37)-N6)-threonylcarbamoyltransferase complex transferase subunit TsaD [Candidatus Omnitrophica bacterium]|nr:tRNA (adenosine(37)-N6)-threonylcarbamoyltransferase complex transferase subunit TsaD [Candidatus Omnitrophota bacterium]
MYVLGIESSCDETSAAVVRDGRKVLSNETSSSLRFHRKYGGVIPEIASRMQLETIAEVSASAVKKARIKLKDINLVSVTCGPGLLGSLLVGISFAKSVSFCLGVPLLGVNHLYGHIYAGLLEKEVQLPFVALVVSGGHTSLFYVKDFDRIQLLGATLDDACGEAFDKVAKILNLAYPGGPVIERLAKNGDARRMKFGCSNTNNPLDFSFSGIKTAVLYYVSRSAGRPVGRLNPFTRSPAYPFTNDIAASFQQAVIDTLIHKALLACKMKGLNRLVIGGGVVANNSLRLKFNAAALRNKIKVYFPPKEFCLDNAAMIAGLGYRLYKKGYSSGLDLTAGG